MGETLRGLKKLYPQAKVMMMSETHPGDQEFKELNDMIDVYLEP